MMIKEKEEQAYHKARHKLKSELKREPTLREIFTELKWKKSNTSRVLNRLIKKGEYTN